MTGLFDLPHAQLRARLATGAPVYLLVNPVEYHGPHLSLHTDHVVSVGLAKDVHAALQREDWPCLIAPDLEIGVDPTPGPGSVHVSFTDVRRRVVEACRALAELGAQRVVLLTFHGSPLHSLALWAGVRELARRGVPACAPLNVLLSLLLSLDEDEARGFAETVAHVPDPKVQDRLLVGLPQDFHAGFFETSVVLHYAPETVSEAFTSVPDCPEFRGPSAVYRFADVAARAGRAQLARELRLVGDGLGWYALRPFPGYTGAPALATPEAGRIFAARIVEAFAEEARRVLIDGAPPFEPILRWTAWLTLGGRIAGPAVPGHAMLEPPRALVTAGQ